MQKISGIFFGIIWCSSTVIAQVSVDKIADLPSKLYETSAVQIYQGKYILTLNDGGNKEKLYVLDFEGKVVRTLEIKDAKNVDWEDLAIDDKDRVYIGDFGNNLNKRKECAIYILDKDLIEDGNGEIKADKITFNYEDQFAYPPKESNMNFDAEAMVWMNDSIYIFTKCRSKPFTGITNVYVLPDKPGHYKARKIGSIQLCDSNWMFCSVTAADYHPKSKKLVILTYSRFYIISNFTSHQFWNGKIQSYNLKGIKQREGIGFLTKNVLYMTDEYRKGFGGGNLYKLSLK
ncbi:hypothetical protein K6119_10205 [Paracrocinitomix mangrovi]|uniref:hypothetical protein n=1 Tax=Paracrocinitomix mangrovi TaxID=2862509 RepID=UPI001C8D8AFF|nr:hypothetical protein [Paracrocinitomix mangrovi]UKN00105.1 hypothetical protein K6119_10205 [Paracrocinitomix mangrovi]